MPGGKEGEGRSRGEPVLLPPVEFDDRRAHTSLAQQACVSQGSDYDGTPTPSHLAEGRKIAMVVVVVAQEDCIDPREILPCDPGGDGTAGPRPGKGSGALGIDGIGKEIPLGCLDEEA
jgi:hypothetical protein